MENMDLLSYRRKKERESQQEKESGFRKVQEDEE
jgi:hypothetical protein